MSRRTFLTIAIASTFLVAAVPVHADHDWGHRYMVYGRVLDAMGEPAAHVPVRVLVETIKGQDPYITVTTDCAGLYYTLKPRTDTTGAYGEAPDWGVSSNKIFVHQAEFKPRGNHHVQVYNGTDEVFHGAWPLDTTVQRVTQNIRLDQPAPAVAACADAPRWDRTYVVTGRIQTEAGREDGNARHDAMSGDGERHEVRVRLPTEDGVVEQVVATNQVGDYFATFQDVALDPDGGVRVSYGGVTKQGRVDPEFRVTDVDIFVAEPAISMVTLTILLGAAGLMLVGGGALYALARAKNARTRTTDDRSG